MGILFTLLPIFNVERFVQPLNARSFELLPIETQLSALKFTVVSAVQFWNVLYPILETALPIVIEVIPVQF